MRIVSIACVASSACSLLFAGQAVAGRAPFAQPHGALYEMPRCPAPPRPVVSLKIGSMYAEGDKSFSNIDEARQESRAEVLAPVREFTAGVSHLANKYVASGGADTYSGACALSWLNDWARAGAMRHVSGDEAQFVRSVDLSGWALAYAQVRYLRIERNSPHAVIQSWLRANANDMRSHVNSLTNVTARNNHRYWAGLAAISVSINISEPSLGSWGLESARVGLSQITREGTLPLELARKSRATHYHLYAAAPLVMTAAIARVNNVDLYSEYGGALHRLVRFATESIRYPKQMSVLAQASQEPIDLHVPQSRQLLAWFEFYNKDFPGRVPAQRVIVQERPLRNAELGGDLTMLAASN
ncbi:MAG: hypothetical protein CMN72_14505 [Sphingomonas sp.]|nr:hypothetical protein [Sphingomonas sp.]